MTLTQAAGVTGTATVPVLIDTGFSNTITTGSLVLGLLILAAAATFTIRSNVAAVWRQQAEGWEDKAKNELEEKERLRHEWNEEKAALIVKQADELESERLLRHEIRDQLAASNAALRVCETELERRPDLSVVLESQSALAGEITRLLGEIHEQQKYIMAVLQAMPKRRVNGEDDG